MRTSDVFGWVVAVTLQPLCLALMMTSLQGNATVRSAGFNRQVAVRVQIRCFNAALDLYRRDVGSAPAAAEGLQALRTDPGVAGWSGPYLDSDIPKDPWGRPYIYRILPDGSCDVVSLGADNKPGGDGANTDVSSRTASFPIGKTQASYLRPVVFSVAALGFFGYPFLPYLLTRLNPTITKPPPSSWPSDQSRSHR